VSTGTNDVLRPRFAELFPTRLLSCKLPEHERLNAGLLEVIGRLRARTSGRTRSNQLGWQSPNLDYGEPAVGELCSRVLERCRDYAEAAGWPPRPGTRLLMLECWANVNPRHAYNQQHQHPNSLLSGVYYVRVPAGDCGDLMLFDPRPQAWVLQPLWGPRGPASPQVHRLAPEEGRLLVFPSWLDHAVAQNTADAERVSISFNVDLRTETSSRWP